jgi:DNA methylase
MPRGRPRQETVATSTYNDGLGDAGSALVTSAASAASAAWEGWGTALKPACEPLCVARKPLSEKSVAVNVLRWGTGALNIDACRIEGENPSVSRRETSRRTGNAPGHPGEYGSTIKSRITPEAYNREHPGEELGRWPANVVIDEEAAELLDEQSGEQCLQHRSTDSGGASRFFYCAKASQSERHESGRNLHPTVKPLDLMKWLVRMVTPPNGIVLDGFAGSGTTGVACSEEGVRAILCDMNPAYVEMIRKRLLDAQRPLLETTL